MSNRRHIKLHAPRVTPHVKQNSDVGTIRAMFVAYRLLPFYVSKICSYYYCNVEYFSSLFGFSFSSLRSFFPYLFMLLLESLDMKSTEHFCL